MVGEEIKISGKVTDFDDNPLKGAVVEVKNDRFEAVYKTHTNSDGEYKISVKKGVYMALMAYKDYKIKWLEYWAWSVPAYQDLQINPRIGGIEVYAMNAFRPQGAYPSLFIYFRPMSLKRCQESIKKTGKIKVNDIAPDLSKDDIEVKIDNMLVKMLELNRVKEYADGIYSLIAYLAQLTLPKRSLVAYLIQAAFHLRPTKSEGKFRYARIDLNVRDHSTEEKGEGCLFCKVAL